MTRPAQISTSRFQCSSPLVALALLLALLVVAALAGGCAHMDGDGDLDDARGDLPWAVPPAWDTGAPSIPGL